MKKSTISKSNTYSEMTEYWDEHALTEVWDQTESIDFKVEIQSERITCFEEKRAKSSILALRGRGKGEHLMERLLKSRREDKIQDERK